MTQSEWAMCTCTQGLLLASSVKGRFELIRMVKCGGLVTFFAIAIMAFGQTISDIPYVATPSTVVKAMLDLAGVTQTDVVFDLGSGDGRIVITAAKEYGAHAIGVELDPVLVRESRMNAERVGVAATAEFVEGDLFRQDLHRATVVTLFLLPSVNLRLKPFERTRARLTHRITPVCYRGVAAGQERASRR